jgi:hypothetical protein
MAPTLVYGNITGHLRQRYASNPLTDGEEVQEAHGVCKCREEENTSVFEKIQVLVYIDLHRAATTDRISAREKDQTQKGLPRSSCGEYSSTRVFTKDSNLKKSKPQAARLHSDSIAE